MLEREYHMAILSRSRSFLVFALVTGVLLLGFSEVLWAAGGDVEQKLTAKVNSVISVATNVGYGLFTLGAIIGGILWGTGNPRGRGVVIGALIGAVVIALASSLVEMMK